MITWWQHLSWSHATLAILLAVLAAGYVLTDSVEDPRAWRFVRAIGSFLRRRVVVRRARRLRRERLPDPWTGGIVREPKYFVPSWNATIGRAYRAWAAERRDA